MSQDEDRPHGGDAGDGHEGPLDPTGSAPDSADDGSGAAGSAGDTSPPEGGVATDVLTDEQIKAEEIAAARERAGDAAEADEANFGQRLIAALTGTSVIVTVLAFVSALTIGAFIVALSEDVVREALGYFFVRPSDTFIVAGREVGAAYAALVQGAIGGPNQLSETLVSSTPLILTGLAVAVPLRAGLFNIGAEGQVVAGGVAAGFIGFALTGWPLALHLPIAIAAGILAGGFYGWIPGVLKARTGAHEVISTIMLNNIGLLVAGYLVSTELFRRPDRTDPVSRSVEASAQFPRLIPAVPGLRVNASLILALVLAVVIFWLVERSTRGFELNAVGLNANAATTAGMNPGRTLILAMSTGGAMAGAAGAAVILGVQYRLTIGFSAGLGFDGITVALLGRGKIGSTVAAGILIGALKAGGRNMQAQTQTSLELALVIQALIIVFIAAPGLVRAIFRIKADDLATGQVAKGWGA
jgi:general nucleoside transport system permease protein